MLRQFSDGGDATTYHLCVEHLTCLLICMVYHYEGQVKGTVDAVTFCKSLQCAGMALQSFGQAREFLILKPEVSEKLTEVTGLWQQVQVCILKATRTQSSN